MFNTSYKKYISYYLRKLLFSKIDFDKDKNFKKIYELRRDGAIKLENFHQNNALSKKIIDCFDEKKDEILNKELPILQKKVGRYNYRSKISKYFDNELLLEYANQRFFIDYINQYFGLKPYLRFISVWLDIPKNNTEEDYSQAFHRDDDDVFLIKTFLCLTDIDKNNGPFQIIKSSHQYPWKKKYQEKHDKITMTANKGDLYLADTNGFHRGMILKNDYRVLLSVHYVSKYPKRKFLNNLIN